MHNLSLSKPPASKAFRSKSLINKLCINDIDSKSHQKRDEPNLKILQRSQNVISITELITFHIYGHAELLYKHEVNSKSRKKLNLIT